MKLPASGSYRRWSSEDARFVRAIMEDFADDAVRVIVLKCSAQSAKTETAMALLQWVLNEAPGPILWLTRDLDEAKLVAKDRINPALDLCEPLKGKLPQSRTKRTTLAIYIMGCLLRLAGAKSMGALDSTPYRYLFCDEARTYPKGALQRVDKRTRSYTHNYKKFIYSTPDLDGDEFDQSHRGGSQNEWLIKCPNPDCGCEQPIEFQTKPDEVGGIRWTENEETLLPDGTPDYEALLATVHWQCKTCEHIVEGRDIEAFSRWRKGLSRDGRWEPTNPKAPIWYRSYHWSAFLPYWSDWRKLVHEYLEARKAAKWGNWELLKEFYQQTLGLSFAERMMSLGEEEALQRRMHDYKPEEVPPPPRAEQGKQVNERRFLTVDVQAKGGRHFYVVIRHWWRGGKSQLLYAGVCYTYDEIRALQEEWLVDPLNVVFDSAFATAEVYAQVLNSGQKWKAFRGEDKYDFRVDAVSQLTAHTTADPAIGTQMQGRGPRISLWRFAKYGCLDRLAMLMEGSAGDWQFHSGVPADYCAQVTAYDKLPVTDKRGMVKWMWHRRRKDDHYASCEMIQVAIAALTGLIYDEPAKEAAAK